MEYNLQPLREQVNKILELLSLNCSMAHDEWMKGDIAKGAYYYCQQRLDDAGIIMQSTDDKLDGAKAYRAASMFIIDLRAVIKDKPDQKHLLENYIQFFRECGFNGTHPHFNVPIE